MSSAFRQAWFAPVFSNLLENRREGLVVLGAGATHLGLSLAGLPGWECPILAVTGIPCPGCGMTHATMQLLNGDVVASLQTHAFAPVALLALVVMFAAFVLPQKSRLLLLSVVRKLEMRNGLTSLVLSALIFYWFVRLMGILPFPNIF
jgi:hypothetical protein